MRDHRRGVYRLLVPTGWGTGVAKVIGRDRCIRGGAVLERHCASGAAQGKYGRDGDDVAALDHGGAPFESGVRSAYRRPQLRGVGGTRSQK